VYVAANREAVVAPDVFVVLLRRARGSDSHQGK
jgi:hypothetical protein